MGNATKTALLLGALSGLLLVLGELLGGANGLVIAFIIAAVMNFASYWFSAKIVLSMYGAGRWARSTRSTSSWGGWPGRPVCPSRAST